ncbi:Serine carboxypeptidase II-3 [Apostasia shenzhenica]|uniref:Serine carboxypeptidase II-3 n=1 Tax=Apostasia shenzhenica TaxID=1088818 RepID=A0A2I0A0Q8_9ASPA|nr:Serine carboxypeptidase II-3 [Apostasia shenzhenica]
MEVRENLRTTNQQPSTYEFDSRARQWTAVMPYPVSSNEAYHLQQFINSPESSKSTREDLWRLLASESRAPELHVSPQDGLMEANKINALPGQPQGVNFDQYAGYVTVDSSAGRALFYYFAEAPHEPNAKPLVLWLNGVANVIFLESPAGVGFSYSNTSSDYKRTGDASTAADGFRFLINWLERFPQYKSRDFFIAGESFAGHYIPQLASLILKNNAANNNMVIKLKGIAAMISYAWTHALISDETYNAIQSQCTFSDVDTADCKKVVDAAGQEMGKINPYDIYAPLCHGSSSSNKSASNVSSHQPEDLDPCTDDYINRYLNIAEVQKALHANVTNLRYPWRLCSSLVGGKKWHDGPDTVLPIIKELIGSGLRVLLYSGDQDSVVPVTSTKAAIDMLKLPITSSWQAWYTNEEVGGYVVTYKGLAFTTVRGAGHMVPFYQPERALVMFSAFLKGGGL